MAWQSSGKTRWIRLTAAVVLLSFGGTMAMSRVLPAAVFGGALFCVSLGVIGTQAVALWREKSDPYDLSKLFDPPLQKPEEPEEDNKLRNVIHCHRCGTSMPETYSICTSCGNRLGT